MTGRDLILKVGGGWHGSSPYLLKGVKYHGDEGLEGRESAGLLDDITRRTLVTRFNDPEDLLRKLRPNVDGVVIRQGHAGATFLPQVWEQLPQKEDFLVHLCLKAGLPRDAWKSGKLEAST